MTAVEHETAGAVLERSEAETSEPALFHVLLHNDDYTTMDFVVDLIVTVFGRSQAEAQSIMMAVHTRGLAVCGTYPHEIAETKVAMVHDLARQHEFPLRASIEGA
jgi:ATP-dependent Clp protease adaptor protein ClpS